MAFAVRHFATKHVAFMPQPFPFFYNVGQRAMLPVALPHPGAFRGYADHIQAQQGPMAGLSAMPIMPIMTPFVPVTQVAPVWTREERRWLKSAVLAQKSAKGTFGPEFWEQISSQIGRLPQDCAYQWRYLEDPEQQEGWTPEEDSHLINLVSSLDAYRRSKNPWSRYPLPPTRGWRDIARELPGRTDEACRRRYAFLAQVEAENSATSTGLVGEAQFSDDGAFDEDADDTNSEVHMRAIATQDKFISLVANYVRFYHENVAKKDAAPAVPQLKRPLGPDTPVAPLIDVGAYLNRIAGWSKYYKHRNSGLATKIHMYGYGVLEVVEALDTSDSAQTPRLYVAYSPITQEERFSRVQPQLVDFEKMTRKTVDEIRSFVLSYSKAHKERVASAPASQVEEVAVKDEHGNVTVETFQEEAHASELPENAAWSINLGRHLKQQQLLEFIKLYGTLTTFLKTVAPNDFIITGDQRDQHIAVVSKSS